MSIPADSVCGVAHNFSVYVDHDDDATVYDATLNQTNASANHNKFYIVQLLVRTDGQDYRTYTRWGRVGETGQDKLLGGGSLAEARSIFEKKFKEKSGLKWSDRHDQPKDKKYTFLPKSYEESSDEEDLPETPAMKRSLTLKSTASTSNTIESTLPAEVQGMMALIFNEQHLANAMQDLHYDPIKLPLGKLSVPTLREGFSVLQELSELIQDPNIATTSGVSFKNAVEGLSNRFLTLIPHVIPRGSRPPIIDNDELIKREMELLENLSDMKLANDIMKDAQEGEVGGVSRLEFQYNMLKLNEMTPLAKDSQEFQELMLYLDKSSGATHSLRYQVEDIFRIERTAEEDRTQVDFSALVPPEKSDRRLLWHGSRTTNFAGILKEGLRIAPKEAPVSGYAFGKGIYLADMSTKSANYCHSYQSGDTGLLLLCEAELGKPMYRLLSGSYSEDDIAALENGCLSTWGVGKTAPKTWKDAGAVNAQIKGVSMPDVKHRFKDVEEEGLYLQYNEYICKWPLWCYSWDIALLVNLSISSECPILSYISLRLCRILKPSLTDRSPYRLRREAGEATIPIQSPHDKLLRPRPRR